MEEYPKRIDWLVESITDNVSIALDSFYDLKFSGTEKLKDLSGEPFIMLPKHQSNIDVLLESIALGMAGRQGNYLMKGALPKFFEYLGGIRLPRAKDIRGCERSERGFRLEEAGQREEEVYNSILPSLLSRGEAVVSHIEGTRRLNVPSRIYKGKCRVNLKKMHDLQEKAGERIPFVPLEIVYTDISKYGSGIEVNVGDPIIVREGEEGLVDLIAHMCGSIRLFEA